ncbi:MAG TPA: 4Fe-4S binding protein [Treponema sp.]|nr:4Fe-4S binding protein [Treponema sp.]
MKISIASGKGGTGKTTIAVSLALSVPGPVVLLDCDVEEPNSGIFFPNFTAEGKESVTVPVPVINESLCTACGECGRFCEFSAIVCLGTSVMVFAELCHSCGGCTMVCPHSALKEEPSRIGDLVYRTIPRTGEGTTEPISFVHGLLSIGKAMSPPLIRAVKKRGTIEAEKLAKEHGCEPLILIDSPPGTSCPMITTVSETDYVILVTEPTPFGLHDLDLAVKTVRKLGLPFGVVINRSDSGDDRVCKYCEREEIPILLQIPEDLRIAQGYSSGKPLVESAPEYRKDFVALAEAVKKAVKAEGKVE